MNEYVYGSLSKKIKVQSIILLSMVLMIGGGNAL
jgi:hypothetical protein